ncbi:hypothetical protein CDD80_3175 [Ophiocordyceps camponoti-rufipedis]|uniref:Fibronectin type-III domain-containing protein n=1 Tax=Ophiocordyceps camponoti-rufipedis TaxID=2004952 RepID=A0A2C5YXL8_9HYPO|nr:hypothetical protein CDD80_3175 [Ophiocordyceps camponoti-rufipedis]
MLWALPTLTAACLALCSLYYFFSRHIASPRSVHAQVGLVGIALLIDCRRQALRLCEAAVHASIDAAPLQQLRMALILGAVVWLLHRSWQTLWKPVPELVSILGVDIPQAPDVCLAGIGADSATLSWSRSASNRPVQKYLIQVNGVHVGESPGNETAITVTGLRPNHFYNLRVVAVGPNNFRAGSPVIRLRTFGKDGRPQLGDSRLPTSFVDPDHSRCENVEEDDKHERTVSSLPMVEAAPVLESSAVLPRDSAVVLSQRRNTVNRRHSPSVAGSDQPPARPSEPELSLTELTDKFEGIRREIEDTLALHTKEVTESHNQELELKRDVERKRLILREKEENTAQLKSEMRLTMETMRAAEKDRAKQEQQLKEKESKKGAIRENIVKFEMDMERMKKERQSFENHKRELAKERDHDICKLDSENTALQNECNQLEADLRDKGKQLQDFKTAKKQQSGVDDDRWREESSRLKRDWELHKRDLLNRLAAETKEGQLLSPQIRDLTDQLKVQQATGLAFYGQPGPSAADYDPSPAPQPARAVHNGNPLLKAVLPSPDRVPLADSNLQAAVGFSSAGFMPRLFMDPAVDGINDIESKVSGETLSPSAQTLLPSDIFEESEDADGMGSRSFFMLDHRPPKPAVEEGPQSPASSNMSFNVFSSPHGSAHNLTFPQYAENGEAKSLNAGSSPSEAPTTSHKLASFLSTLQRGRAAKCSDGGGPPIGSLKPAQSQSFPSATDEDAMGSRRRINIGSWVVRDSDTSERARPPSATPIGTSRPLSAMRPNPHKGSPAVAVSDREDELSRPASIASMDLPRPSTDSGSIWGAPGDSMALHKNRLWPRGEGPWPSRSGSRRPSLQGATAPTTTLASADDEILGEDELLNPETLPSQIGVIGSRPPAAVRTMSQRLNPAAPTFMAHIFRKDKDKDKGKAKEVATSAGDLATGLDRSPSGSWRSRDGHSIHTQVSTSESRESLQLDSTVSNAASDLQSPSASSLKDPDKAVRKLFRKGSSSKFSLSTRLGKDSSLFKKGSGSSANSDRNTPAEHRSSMGDADDVGDDGAMLGRSFDSMASSSSLGPSKSKEGRETGRISSWRFSMSSIKKKGRDTPVKDAEQTPEDG